MKRRIARLVGLKQMRLDGLISQFADLSECVVAARCKVSDLTAEIARERVYDLSGMEAIRQDWIRHHRVDLADALTQFDRLNREAGQWRKRMIDAQAEIDGLKQQMDDLNRRDTRTAQAKDQAGADEIAIAAHYRRRRT